MSRTIIRFGVPLLGGALVSLSLFACSSSDSTPAAKPEAGVGTGGATGAGGSSAGGKAASGGAPAAGGAAAQDAGHEFTCKPKTPGTLADGGTADPGGTVAAGAGCCGEFGVCTTKADLASDPSAGSYGHAECKASADLFCAPKPASQLPDGGQTPSCHTAFGSLSLEGRCLPDCFTLSNANASQINAGDCPKLAGYNIVCAPCYDPTTGAATGACSRNGDAPVEAKKQFAECGVFPADAGGAKQGLCVPTDLVAKTGADPKLVPQDTCATGELCAPKNKVLNQGSCFEHCAATLGGAGTCVPTYLVEALPAGHGYSSVLGKGTVGYGGTMPCQDGETCTPCISPLDQSVTGACSN